MVEITIDGKLCDFRTEESIALKYNCEDLSELENGREGSTVKFIMPMSATNAEIFGIEGDVHPQTKFNSQWHPMCIVMDGITLFSGTAYLMEVYWAQDENYVEVECRGGVTAWVEEAYDTLFKNIAIDYSSTLTEANIKASWEDDSPIKFFPITRDSYEDEGSSEDVTGVRLLRSIDDYHPFIQISALIEAIFTAAGYRIESETLEDEEFSSLYMSGDYSSAENEAAQEYMGFYIKRGEDTSTTTDTLGRVGLSPYDGLNSVGNIVSMSTLDDDAECYNHGNVLQVDGTAVIFKPLTSISVGFEYYLHYTCDCSIESRTTLKGIDRLNTIDNGTVSWEITNRNIDQRDEVVSGVSYKLLIFDFEEGETYRLYSVNSSGTSSYIETTDRETSVIFSSTPSTLTLHRYVDGANELYSSDWALYFGYVELTTPTEVKITVRSAPKTYSPTSPMEFEFQLLEGADAAADFTLHSDTSIRPYFSAYPGYNSSLTFETIGQHSFSALDTLSALGHLFNLRFSTNEAAKLVTIESFDKFYNGTQWDWSDKVIEGSEIEFTDWAHSANRVNTLGYQQTDGVVNRMGESDNAYFGEWSYSIDSYAASSTDKTTLNPIFSASTNDEDDGSLVVGDRDDLETVNSLSFSPRIARLFGLREVENENYSLPYAAFHEPDEGFTLCFEDRDGATGLNRLYLNEVELTARSQIISLSLKLSALDYSNLFEPHAAAPSLRDRFYFSLQGESFLTILYSIESFNPESGEAKCSFLTIN